MYSAGEAAQWGIMGWLTSDGSTPLLDIFNQAGADMVNMYLAIVFKALSCQKTYLRIQVLPYLYTHMQFSVLIIIHTHTRAWVMTEFT